MIGMIVQIFIAVTLLLITVYFTRPKKSKTDQFFLKFNAAIKKNKVIFEYPIEQMAPSEIQTIQVCLDRNKINYSFYNKKFVPTMAAVIRPGQEQIIVNAYMIPFSHPPKPQFMRSEEKEAKIILVDFKNKQRIK